MLMVIGCEFTESPAEGLDYLFRLAVDDFLGLLKKTEPVIEIRYPDPVVEAVEHTLDDKGRGIQVDIFPDFTPGYPR